MFGVLRVVERPVCENLARSQIHQAQEASASSDLRTLFNSGEAREVAAGDSPA